MSDSDNWSSTTSDSSSDPLASALGPSLTDSVTDVTHQSIFERIGKSLIGILIGLVLIPASCFGLFWNENRAVETARALTEGAGLAVTVPSDRVDAANDGKLIHMTGTLRGADLRDTDFGVTSRAVRLVRHVEMYQWRETSKTETRKTLGGGEEKVTTYSYDQTWSDRALDSSRFRQRDNHSNPPMSLQGLTVTADDPMLGAFHAVAAVNALGSDAETALRVPDSTLSSVTQRLGDRGKIVDGKIYAAIDPSSPRIGDLRISYSIVPERDISVAARQQAGGLQPYKATNGREIFLVETGTRSAAEMFKDAQDSNRVLTWILRLVGFIALIIGFYLILAPLAVFASIIPFLGSVVEAGAGLAAFLMALVVGIPVIAIAWLAVRPLLAGALIAGMIAAVFGLRYLSGLRRASRAAQPQVAPSPAAPAPLAPKPRL